MKTRPGRSGGGPVRGRARGPPFGVLYPAAFSHPPVQPSFNDPTTHCPPLAARQATDSRNNDEAATASPRRMTRLAFDNFKRSTLGSWRHIGPNLAISGLDLGADLADMGKFYRIRADVGHARANFVRSVGSVSDPPGVGHFRGGNWPRLADFGPTLDPCARGAGRCAIDGGLAAEAGPSCVAARRNRARLRA